VCTRSGKSEWIPVTDKTGQSKKINKRLQKKVEEQHDMASEVEDQLKVLSYKKGRRKTSTKCECTWAVNFAKPPPRQKNPLVRVTTMKLEHTNGCSPSAFTFQKHERRLGRIWSKTLLMQGQYHLDFWSYIVRVRHSFYLPCCFVLILVI
jgi:hypothetical protein